MEESKGSDLPSGRVLTGGLVLACEAHEERTPSSFVDPFAREVVKKVEEGEDKSLSFSVTSEEEEEEDSSLSFSLSEDEKDGLCAENEALLEFFEAEGAEGVMWPAFYSDGEYFWTEAAERETVAKEEASGPITRSALLYAFHKELEADGFLCFPGGGASFAESCGKDAAGRALLADMVAAAANPLEIPFPTQKDKKHILSHVDIGEVLRILGGALTFVDAEVCVVRRGRAGICSGAWVCSSPLPGLVYFDVFLRLPGSTPYSPSVSVAGSAIRPFFNAPDDLVVVACGTKFTWPTNSTAGDASFLRMTFSRPPLAATDIV